MTAQMIFVLIMVVMAIVALSQNKMRQGLLMFSTATILYIGKAISAEELLMGFSNKAVFTIGLLFLVSEGVRRSTVLNRVIKPLLPKTSGKNISKTQLRLLPGVAFMSSMINNTPVVIIVAPLIKAWAEKMRAPASKFLIPLSFATILGGMCTLIGSSTNLVVHGLMINEGYSGFTMYELGKVGIFIAIAGLIYLIFFSKYLLPKRSNDESELDIDNSDSIQAIISARFPGINQKFKEFDFKRAFGAEILAIKRRGMVIQGDLSEVIFEQNDTLVLKGDDSFFSSWGNSSFFILLVNGKEHEAPTKKKKYLALALLIFMCVGATVGESPGVREVFPNVRLDMFFFALITTFIMAWTQMFPAKRYTKFISWDLLITIASAFAIAQAMQNSGITELLATKIIGLSQDMNPYIMLGSIYIITNLFTEFITNNAAAALSFPIAVSLAGQMGVSPMPFFVTICIASSASFCSPIGYQTNLIVQGIGNYKFSDFFRVGLPLSILTFIISLILIPLIWSF